MKSFSFSLVSSRMKYFAVAIALLLAVIIPAIVSAAQLTERSIALSSSSVDAENVTYTVKFTSVEAAGAFVLDFCSNSPVIGSACSVPSGLSVTNAASTTSGFTTVDDLTTSTIRVTGTIAAATPIEVAITGIDNPSAAGPLYARIVTYDTPTNAADYDSDDLDPGTGIVDQGGAAISINNTIGVSGAVLESMTFCVSGAAITKDCGNPTSPVLALGETVGSVKALIPTAVSTGSIFTQISTNASTGAVISLKSNATDCGGLKRAGAPTACDIAPALLTGIAIGEAKFGVRTATATDSSGADAVGVLVPVTGSGYNSSTFALNYANGNSTGVTSPFGDPFLDTGGAPANNKNMELTFGASVSNNTPAGLYSVDLGLIATGKF